MNASKAKRRLLRWHRYLRTTHSMPVSNRHAGYHRGHTDAYWDYMTAQRTSSHGLRIPLTAWSERGDA